MAQGSGVVVDPDSPAGKEYALPLESARRDAGGGGGPDSSAAPLFGAGISRSTSDHSAARSGSATQRGRTGGSGSGQAEDQGGGEKVGSAAEPRSSAAAVDRGGDGPSPELLTALIALGVLAVGGAIGVSVRALRPAGGHR